MLNCFFCFFVSDWLSFKKLNKGAKMDFLKNPEFSTGDRIKLVRGLKGLKQNQLSKKLKTTSRWSLGRLERDERTFQFEEVDEISNVLGVSPSWLCLGMTKPSGESYPENLSDFECSLVLAWREKNIEALAILIGYLAAGSDV